MKTSDFITENPTIALDAHVMHKDHEVQMAREECYHIANNAIELHKLLQQVNEAQGIDGWVAEKISLANDYCRTVREYLEYELMSKQSMTEDADAGATTSATIAAAPPAPLFKKKKIIKRNMP